MLFICKKDGSLRLAEGEEWKTAFCIRYGSYEFQVIHYGLTNISASFQRFMNDVFKDCWTFVFSFTLMAFLLTPRILKYMRSKLAKSWTASLSTACSSRSKSASSVDVLGFVINLDGTQMGESKVKVFQDWPTPRRVKDVQSFLGFTNFYQRCIINFSNMTVPLTRLTCKNMPWNWASTCQEAFALLKWAFTTVLCPCHFDLALHPIVETDAPDYAIASIFSLRDDEGMSIRGIL